MQELLLFTRQGCCLCEGLEEKLGALDPPQPLHVIDVDTDPVLQGRYGLAVPVLAVAVAVAAGAYGPLRELPRVSPRLAGAQLQAWLIKQGVR
ncbi:glutaredoxin family protein [Cyanobium sp. N.Huapi 1H5]|uniref:glutaredoxin family protein n=1 Tax=Cyanobium sp. N.Huapi 1H5 TaxID=2823719 RepID=UPI0020CEE35C|nr:glutaredoxin family protein [Cyanobium sp. N.Huapi 1H5]MCP9837791.1 glutaredoxin family protein [Cyanobium sp. N.Huapi 1H5]